MYIGSVRPKREFSINLGSKTKIKQHRNDSVGLKNFLEIKYRGIIVKTEKVIETNRCIVMNSIAVLKLKKENMPESKSDQPLLGNVNALGNSPRIIVSIAYVK
tara:strand:+ start:1694 stop:2002 length:309 start_codon:yes stop_codon:yes gene_type:complete